MDLGVFAGDSVGDLPAIFRRRCRGAFARDNVVKCSFRVLAVVCVGVGGGLERQCELWVLHGWRKFPPANQSPPEIYPPPLSPVLQLRGPTGCAAAPGAGL